MARPRRIDIGRGQNVEHAGFSRVLLESPTAIPGYRLQQQLERRPGSWTVYRGTELAGGRDVALTILSAQLNHDRAYGERLLRDMRRLTRLAHPQLVPVLAAGRVERGLFVASELPDLISLDATLGVGAVLRPEEVIRLFEPVADLLDRAHAQDLLHRGLSPATIVLSPAGQARVTGFGLADHRAAARGPDRAMLDYMAPEQFAGGQPSALTDVYGLAATILSCLTGVDDLATAEGKRRAGLPEAVDRVLSRALADLPEARPESAGRLIGELRAANGRGEPARPPRQATAVPRRKAAPAPGSKRLANVVPKAGGRLRGRRQLALLTGAAVVAIVAGTAVAALTATADDPPPAERARVVTAATDRLSLTAPAGWSAVESPATVPGLALEQPVALARRPTGRASAGVLTAGFVTDPSPWLVSATTGAERVRIGRYEGWRLQDLELGDDAAALDLYVIPTSAGAATVACQAAETGSASFARDCEAVATTLVLSGVSVEPVGPSPEYTRALSDSIDDLNAQRRGARAALLRADTAAEQSRLADALAGSYEAAAKRQAEVARSLGTARFNDQLVERLRAVRDGYRAMAAAARRERGSSYAAARATVVERERRVRALLDSFA